MLMLLPLAAFHLHGSSDSYSLVYSTEAIRAVYVLGLVTTPDLVIGHVHTKIVRHSHLITKRALRPDGYQGLRSFQLLKSFGDPTAFPPLELLLNDMKHRDNIPEATGQYQMKRAAGFLARES